jgi:hypothetical protein
MILRCVFSALLLGLVALVVVGCVSSRSGGAVSTREILTADEISRTTALTAYDAIQTRNRLSCRVRNEWRGEMQINQMPDR